MATSFTFASTCRTKGIAGALAALVLSCGCARTGPESDLERYVGKLARVLDVDAVAPLPAHPVRLPSVRDLRWEPAVDGIDIVDFLRIGRCELQQVIARRNSSLGRLAEPSQALVLELNFLAAAERCLPSIRDDYPELHGTLATTLARKRQDLPLLVWQATLGGDEFRSFWQPGSGPLPDSFHSDKTVMLALRRLRGDVERWLAGDYAIDPVRLEALLSTIRAGSGGVQLRAWSMLSARLDAATEVARRRSEARPLCYPDMVTPDARVFDSVVRQDFVGGIQRWAAGLNTLYYDTFPAVTALEESLSAGEPIAYLTWRTERTRRLRQATDSLARHVVALKPLLAQCHFLPGVSG